MVLSPFAALTIEAKHRHQHPPRCLLLGETCTVASSPLCCDGLRCDQPFKEKEGTICCAPGGSVCDPTQPERCCDPFSCTFTGFCATT
jgi:hypothetical protein